MEVSRMDQADTDNVHELESNWDALCNQIHVRRLLHKMRSHGVFSKDEYEEIMNDTLNPTSITKASCFLDHLQRKGRDGYNVFLKCLGETHPNVYKRLTGQEPEAPVSEPISGSYTQAPRLRFVNEIEDLYQEVEDLQRELGFSQQLKYEQERAIESLNQMLQTANVKAERCDKIEKSYRKERYKVKQLEMERMTLLGNSLLHKQEKEQAELNLAQKRKEVNELERRLRDAQNHAEIRRQIWHKSCLDKQQLKVAREEMLQRMSTMEEELKQAKRHEDVVSAIAAEDFHIDQYTQATLNILREELQNYKEKCEELAGSLLKARNDLHCRDTELEKCKSENEELLQKRLSAETMADTFKKHYNITWRELNKVKQERLRANDDRDQAQIEARYHIDQLHNYQKEIHDQLQSFQSVDPPPPEESCTQLQSATESMEAQTDFPGDNNAILSTEDKTHSDDLLHPCGRDRITHNISSKRTVSTDNKRPKVDDEDTFPEEYFPFSSNPIIAEVPEFNPWLQRHHSENIGESRRVHPGSSFKNHHLLANYDDFDDGDFDDLQSLTDDDEKEDVTDNVTGLDVTQPQDSQSLNKCQSTHGYLDSSDEDLKHGSNKNTRTHSLQKLLPKSFQNKK